MNLASTVTRRIAIGNISGSLLFLAGARPTDRDANGKTVMESARLDWVQDLLGKF